MTTRIHKSSPGPGSYDIPTKLSKRSAILLGRTLPKSSDNQVGPGSYETDRKLDPRSASVGRSLRFLP